MNLKDTVEEKVVELALKFGPKLIETREVVEQKIKIAEDYLDAKKEAYENMDPEKRKDLKKSLIGAAVTVAAPWYAAIPAGLYAYKKGKDFFGKKEETEETEEK